MRRIPPVVMAVLALVVSGAPARSATGLPDGYVLDAQRELVAGVEHSVLTRDDPASAVNVARIAPGAPVALRAVSSDNGINHHGDKLETPSSMCRRVGCVVAVNGDFHHVAEREPVGGVISDGRMLRSPVGGRPQLVVTTDGRIVAAPLDWTGLVDTGGADLAMRGINTTTHPDDGRIVLYTPDWGTHTETDDAAEIVVRSDGPLAVLGRPTQVELTSYSTDGDATIPSDGAVLSATGAGAAALAELWDDVQAGTVPATAEILVDSPVDAAESLGGNPKLLSDGQAVFPDADDGFTTDRHSRTVVGWNGQGEVFVVAVDGRQDDSKGMDLAELAEFMIELGATEAINLDGGGGTTFVVDGIVTNTPIHQGEEGHERGSANALVVVPTAAPPTPGPPPGGGPAPGSSTDEPPLGGGPAPGGPSTGGANPISPFSPAIVPPPGPRPSGYWMVGADGTVHTFGDARPWGSALGQLGPHVAVDLEPTPTGRGYWIVDDIGRVYAFGDARHIGNADPGRLAPGETVTSLSSSRSGYGYWIFTSRGRVLRFGDAPFLGDMSAVTLNGPVLDSIPTPSGRGYYMVASDGGIFTFGDARFFGSMGGVRLNAPVQSLVPDTDGVGYWLVASDGGVFSFDASFRGSMGAVRLNQPVTGMVPYGNGYLMVASDGGIFNFSDRAFSGSLGDNPPASPVVSVAAFAG